MFHLIRYNEMLSKAILTYFNDKEKRRIDGENGFSYVTKNLQKEYLISSLMKEIKKNLVLQLTGAVRWTQIMENILKDGANQVIEVGPGRVLQGLFKKVNRDLETESASI